MVSHRLSIVPIVLSLTSRPQFAIECLWRSNKQGVGNFWAKFVKEGVNRCKPNFNTIWRRYDAIVCEKNCADILCRFSTLHERVRRRDRQTNKRTAFVTAIRSPSVCIYHKSNWNGDQFDMFVSRIVTRFVDVRRRSSTHWIIILIDTNDRHIYSVVVQWWRNCRCYYDAAHHIAEDGCFMPCQHRWLASSGIIHGRRVALQQIVDGRIENNRRPQFVDRWRPIDSDIDAEHTTPHLRQRSRKSVHRGREHQVYRLPCGQHQIPQNGKDRKTRWWHFTLWTGNGKR